MKVSNLLENTPNKQKAFLTGMLYAWPIFTKDSKYIFAYSGYKKGLKDTHPILDEADLEFYIKEHFNKLKSFLGEEMDIINNKELKDKYKNFDRTVLTGVSVVFENDLEKELIYSKIEKWLIDIDDELKKWFLIGFMEGRGSLDFTANFYAIDITQRESPELAKRKLNRMNDILGMVYNYNPRILQEKSNQKNDQFRINLKYFAGHYGFFRPHIIDYYKNSTVNTLSSVDDVLFLDNSYANMELEIKASNLEINALSVSLRGLSKDEKLKKAREYKLLNFDFDTEDEIAYSSYNTKERAKSNADYLCEFNTLHSTFTSKSTNRKYVEAHHLIPFAKRKDFELNIDIEENLVALCPNCHRRIHLSKDNERVDLLNNLYNLRRDLLKRENISVTKESLYEMYGVSSR